MPRSFGSYQDAAAISSIGIHNPMMLSFTEKIKLELTQFKAEYKAYFEANKTEGDIMFEACASGHFNSGDWDD